MNTALSTSLNLSDLTDTEGSFDILLNSTYILHQIQFGREVFVRPTNPNPNNPSVQQLRPSTIDAIRLSVAARAEGALLFNFPGVRVKCVLHAGRG